MYVQPTLKIVVATTDVLDGQRLADELGERLDGTDVVWSGEEATVAQGCADPEAVLIVDARMDALARTMRARHPELAIVMTAPVVDDRCVAMAVAMGVVGLVAAPADPATIASMLNTPAASSGLGGTSRGVSTARLLTLYGRAGKEGVLHLAHPLDGRFGSVHLEGGQAVHASCAEQEGPCALKELLQWKDATATWLPGRTRCRRTIIGRLEAVIDGPLTAPESTPDEMVPIAYRGVVEKLSRLAQTQDIMGAFLMRNAEVLTGRCSPHLDEALISRALTRLANVFHDVDGQQGEDAGGEIQAMVGTLRLVVDRIGDPSSGFQVGVVVRQASPVCKSLRRLLRQIDRSFRKHQMRASNARGGDLAVA